MSQGGGRGHGALASAMGSLNASHASQQAFAHASHNSVVGQLAAYASALNQGNLSAAAQSLAKASNHALTAQVVTAVNANLANAGVLSVSVSAAQAAKLAAMANADR